VTERTLNGADQHIDAMAKKYLGKDTYPSASRRGARHLQGGTRTHYVHVSACRGFPGLPREAMNGGRLEHHRQDSARRGHTLSLPWRLIRIVFAKLIDQLIRDNATARRERPKTIDRLRFLYGKRLWGRPQSMRASSEIISPTVFRSRCARSLCGLKHVIGNIECRSHASDASASPSDVHRFSRHSRSTTGKRTVKTLPVPGLELPAVTEPPCSCASVRTMKANAKASLRTDVAAVALGEHHKRA